MFIKPGKIISQFCTVRTEILKLFFYRGGPVFGQVTSVNTSVVAGRGKTMKVNLYSGYLVCTTPTVLFRVF